MKIILKEALDIEGLVYIGSDVNYDVYRADTYAGAQQLVDLQNHPVGDAFAQNENTFTGHIGPDRNMQMYLFTQIDTNRVVAAILTCASADNTFTITRDFEIDSTNLQFESGISHDEYYYEMPHILPLYLIKDFIRINNATISDNGCIINNNNNLIGILPELMDNLREGTSITIPENVEGLLENSIRQDILNRDGLNINEILIPENVRNAQRNSLIANNQLTVTFESEQLPESFNRNWITGNPTIEFDGFLTPEERAAREEQRRIEAERAEQERLRAEEEARLAAERAEQERQERLRQANANRLQQGLYNDENGITYKLYKDHAEVIFAKKRVERRNARLTIASEIEGKPVTKIASYAFSNSNIADLIVIPNSVTEIGVGAFLNCNSRLYLYNNENYLKSLKLSRDSLFTSGVIAQSRRTYLPIESRGTAYDFIYDRGSVDPNSRNLKPLARPEIRDCFTLYNN